MVARALLRNSASIEEWLAASTFVKYCTLIELFPLTENGKNGKLTWKKRFLGKIILLWIIVFSHEPLLII